ncbi:MAG: hypothetical protein GQ574_06835 [Crocinitomix sp.]|nr:hypothetical protein [Crocinitomix sp.]
MSWWKRNIDIILILLVGFTLRFTISFTHSYSNDELSAVSRLRYTNFSDLLEFGVQNDDMHPAGVQVFMKAWSMVAGKSEIAMRFPFVLFGTAAILVLFLIGKQWFNRKVGLLAAGLLAVLYFPIMNSEFARPYSPGLLISLLVGLYFFRVLFNQEKKWRDAILLGLLFAAGMYTHYFTFLFVGFIGFTGLFFLNKANIKYYAVAGLLGILLFLPHYSITQYHLSVGGLQWLAPPDADWLLQFLYHAFNDSWIIVVCLAIALGIGFFLKTDRAPFSKRNLALPILWFFGIYLVGHILSYVSTPILKFPVMLFAFPFFLLLIAVVLSKIPKTNILLVALMTICLGSTLVEKDLYGNAHYALFKEPGIKIADWNKEFGAENIYTVYNLNNSNYINFYVDEWGGDSIDFDWINLEFDDDYKLRKELLVRDEEYCVIGFSSRLTLVNLFETVKEFYPTVVDYEQYNNGSVFLMKRGDYDNPARVEKIARFDLFGTTGFTYNLDKINGESKSDFCYVLDSSNQYGPTYLFQKKELKGIDHYYLKVDVTTDLIQGDKLTVALTGERNGETITHRGENMWIGHDLEDMILSSKSNSGYFAFKIPPYILPMDNLKISLWNRGGTSIRIQSIQVSMIENIWN